MYNFLNCSCLTAICCCNHENTRAKNNCTYLQLWENGVHRSQKVSIFQLRKKHKTYENIYLKASCSLFPSSEEQSRLAARKYARVVQKLGFPAKFLDFKIQNMVGSCDVKFPIRLEGLVLTHQQFSRFVIFTTAKLKPVISDGMHSYTCNSDIFCTLFIILRLVF